MKKIFNLILLLLLVATVRAQVKATDEPFLTKSLSAESIREIFSRTSGGSISVSGVNAGEARIEVFVYPSGNRTTLTKEEIQKKLDEDYELTVSVENAKLTAVAKQKSSSISWKRALAISFKIFVPKNVSTDLSTSGGGITLTNLSGTHNFSTSGGGLTIDMLTGKIRGRTSGGGITVKNTGDDIDLATSGGGIEADNCTGKISLSTSGGRIELSSLQGTIDARTSGGPVRANKISGELAVRTSGGSVVLRDLACSVNAHTSGGNMEVAIRELGKFITVSNSGGNIDLEVPRDKGLDLKLRAERIKVEGMNNFTGEQDEHKISGKMNGGGIPVDASTSGSISLALR
ncbi:MAG TPA: hypothetical protein VF490_21555 [Chryseosolibacter sp.]